jgi:hypothetical protein
MEKIMTAFKSLRVAHEYTQTNSAPPEEVFPLLCPVREADWAPGWQYRLIYSDSGVAELGCVFTTPNPTVDTREPRTPSDQMSRTPAEATWITVDYDAADFRIAFVWIQPAHVATEIWIQLSRADDGNTRAHIRYRYTGLSPEGNREIESYDEHWFRNKMQGWEAAINHYLRTGRMIAGAARE